MRSFVLGALLLCSGCLGLAAPVGSLGDGASGGVLTDPPLPVAGGGDGSSATGGGAGGGFIAAGGGAGGGIGGGAGGGGGDELDSGEPFDAGPTDPCATLSCTGPSHCVQSPPHCECDPGFFPDGGACVPADPGIPAQRTKQQVCSAYQAGQVITDPQPFSKSTATCDEGTLSQAGMLDTLNRLNMYRWLAGLGPAHLAADHEPSQQCALISANNPAGMTAHHPDPTATCYTQLGAGAAGSSNIAWGSYGPANAMDIWIDDPGNQTTMGHRRWLLNPPYDPMGFGYYEGGGYGSAACVSAFGSSNNGPHPDNWTWPPAGFVPQGLAMSTWTVHGNNLYGLDAGVTRASDGAAMPVTITYLASGYGADAVSLERQSWNPAADETYDVVVDGPQLHLAYEVKPVSCP